MSLKRLSIAAGIAASAFAATAAHAHAKLETSEPLAGSVLASAPKQLRLGFNEALEPGFSKIRLVDSRNAEIALPRAQVDKTDPTAMTAPLPALPSGTYRVQWTTMTHDGHKTKGDFTFQVK